MQKCKIKSIRSLGYQMTYNVTMKSEQHNYKIFDSEKNISIITANSHSAAYAFIAYQTAWLKHYYPIEFMCALLSSEIQNNDKNLKLTSYISQAESMGITVIGPDINKSGMKYKIEEGVRTVGDKKGQTYNFIRTPLSTLSGVGSKAVEEIVAHAPYRSLNEFLHKVDGSKVNCRVFAAMVEQNAMTQSFRMKSDEILAEYEKMRVIVKKEKESIKKEKEKEEEFGGSIFDKLG